MPSIITSYRVMKIILRSVIVYTVVYGQQQVYFQNVNGSYIIIDNNKNKCVMQIVAVYEVTCTMYNNLLSV